MSKARPARARTQKSPPSDEPLTLDYDLAELPTSQHRAGLAGLVLMHRWRARQPDPRGVCELQLRDRGLTLRMDRPGLDSLLDLTYAADLEERTKKTRKKTVYPVVVPHGAYLADWDPTGERALWLGLWRQMMWEIIRGKPRAQDLFKARANGKPDTLGKKQWNELRRAHAPVPLSSTYYLGAQAKSAENVPFRDIARLRFLLHFWPFVAQVYRPVYLDADGKRRFRGYAIAVPDVAHLEELCDELEHAMRGRSPEPHDFRDTPRDAVIDLPAESALDFMSRLGKHIAEKHDYQEELIYGVDVLHVEKAGNDTAVLSAARLDVEQRTIDRYRTLREGYGDHIFRRRRLLNLLDKQPWHAGFDGLLCNTPRAWTIESPWFGNDARRAFTEIENTMSENTDTRNTELQALIYRVVGAYIGRKLESKHQLSWDDVKQLEDSDPKRKKYRETRQDIARDAFLAIRSRTGSDFIDYFSGTLFSVPQKLDESAYTTISQALLEDTATVRTLTLLALSARA